MKSIQDQVKQSLSVFIRNMDVARPFNFILSIAAGDQDKECLNKLSLCGDPAFQAQMNRDCAGTCTREAKGQDQGECSNMADLCNETSYSQLMSAYCRGTSTNSSNNKENVDKPTSESSSTKVPSLSFASTTSNKPKKNKKQKIKNTSGVFLPANAMSLPSSDKKNTNFVTSQITIPYTIPSSEPKNEAAFPIHGSLDSYAEAVDQLKNVPESTDVDDESFGAFETDLEKSPDTGNQLDDMCDGVHMPQTTFDNAANVISVVGKQEVIEELEVQRNEHDQQIDTEKQEMQASTAQVDMNANELQQRSVKHHFAFFQGVLEGVNNNFPIQQLKAGLLQAKHSCVLAETISDKIQDEIIHPGQVLAGPMYEHFVYKRVETALTKAESLIENSTFGPYAAFAAVCGLVTGRLALGLAWEAAGKVKQAGHQVLTFFIKQQ
uniref:ShKT domain-containing protein n=1 Tax=Ditylenchus dipsaci TaxID=166011 RepID=A0A915ECM2_9BILA